MDSYSAVPDLDLTGRELVEVTEDELEIITSIEPADITAASRDSLDWSNMTAMQRQEVSSAADRIHSLHASAYNNFLEIGKELTAVKEILGHGKFIPWLEAEFNWAERTAQRFMNYHATFSTTPAVVASLPQATLDKLAAKSTPAEVRAEIVKDIEGGTVPGPGEIADRINQAREVARQAKEAEEAKRQAEALANKIAAMTPDEKEAYDKAEKEKARREKDARKRKETRIERQDRELEERKREREERERVAMEFAKFVQDKMGDDFGEFCERLEHIPSIAFNVAIADLYRQMKQPTALTVVGATPLGTAA